VPWLRQLKADIGLAGGLAQRGVDEAQVPRLVAVAAADVCHRTNPRPCTPADFQRFFETAM
jgi:alcohol dehydrogenase class IV